MDDVAASYGWVLHHTLQHTPHQMRMLRDRRAIRIAEERKILCNMIRAAQAPEREDFERFLSSLEPVVDREAADAKPSLVMPDGFTYSRD